MVFESASPCMKHSEEAGKIAADMPFIAGQLLDGRGRRIEKSGISHPLVAADEAAYALRNREGDQEVMAGKQLIQVGFQPLAGLVVLACGTVTVAAGAINSVEKTALLTPVMGGTRLSGAASGDGIDDFYVLPGHVIAKALDVFVAEGAEDLIYGFH